MAWGLISHPITFLSHIGIYFEERFPGSLYNLHTSLDRTAFFHSHFCNSVSHYETKLIFSSHLITHFLFKTMDFELPVVYPMTEESTISIFDIFSKILCKYLLFFFTSFWFRFYSFLSLLPFQFVSMEIKFGILAI